MTVNVAVGWDIPLFKDPLMVLDYASFWNRPDTFPDYVFEAQSTETIAKLQSGLHACSAKISRATTAEVLLYAYLITRISFAKNVHYLLLCFLIFMY